MMEPVMLEMQFVGDEARHPLCPSCHTPMALIDVDYLPGPARNVRVRYQCTPCQTKGVIPPNTYVG